MKTRFASVICAAIMTFSIGTTALAQQDPVEKPVQVEVKTIVGAQVTYTLAEVGTNGFPATTFSFKDETTTGDLLLTVTDNRGSAEGWNLKVSATDFKGETPTNTFSAARFSLAPGTVVVNKGQDDPKPTAKSVTMSTTPKELFNAEEGSGNGEYQVTLTGTIVVPGATLADTYTTTITVELSDAP